MLPDPRAGDPRPRLDNGMARATWRVLFFEFYVRTELYLLLYLSGVCCELLALVSLIFTELYIMIGEGSGLQFSHG